MFSFLTTT